MKLRHFQTDWIIDNLNAHVPFLVIYSYASHRYVQDKRAWARCLYQSVGQSKASLLDIFNSSHASFIIEKPSSRELMDIKPIRHEKGKFT